MRADGWFDALTKASPSVEELCEIVGEKFVAFSIIAGVRVTSVTVNEQVPDTTLIDFVVGDEEREHRLLLSEFRRRLGATVLGDEPCLDELPDEPTPEDIQSFVGFRTLLLAPLFGVSLRSLKVDETGPRIDLEENGQTQDLSLAEVRELIRVHVRDFLQASEPASPFSIDLGAVSKARELIEKDDFEGVVELLGAWPGPLSLLLRTAEGQNLSPDVKSALGGALGMLGTSYARTGKFDWAEEVMRLGIQWNQDGQVAAELFHRLGEAYVARQRFGQAIGLLRRALALGATEQHTLPLLAECFLARSRNLAALVCVQSARLAGAESAKLSDIEKVAEGRLGEAWKKFRDAVNIDVDAGSS